MGRPKGSKGKYARKRKYYKKPKEQSVELPGIPVKEAVVTKTPEEVDPGPIAPVYETKTEVSSNG